MKLNPKITLFIALIALFYSISLIQSTYAKYVTSAEASTNITIARWNIKLNNQDVVSNSNFSELITPVINSNPNIKPNVIAPTAEGYFDITLDGSTTDVSFRYVVSIAKEYGNNISDFGISSYSVNGVNQVSDGVINGYIDYTDTVKVHTIRVYFSWKDGDGETMDNAADTEATVSGNANFRVNVTLIQTN